MKRTVFVLCQIVLAFSSLAQIQSNARHFNTSKGLGIEGYDPVAYFTRQQALPGKEEIFTVYHGVKYQFRSTENKLTFEKSPLKYLPQYGGWCAYAMGATGEKVQVDPLTFKIKDGKLYLFYNRFFNNTLTKWNANEAVLENQANEHWDKIIGKTETRN
jgi:YHS domain-containing protein